MTEFQFYGFTSFPFFWSDNFGDIWGRKYFLSYNGGHNTIIFNELKTSSSSAPNPSRSNKGDGSTKSNGYTLGPA